jgi:hypothetical protein
MRLIHQINDMNDIDELTNRTASSCWHITCHVIMMGDWVVISCKGGCFLQLANEQKLKKNMKIY